MIYSDIVNAGLILPKKTKYTMADVHNVQTESLFTGKTLSEQEAVFVVKCSAIFHDTDYSETIKNYTSDQNTYKIF